MSQQQHHKNPKKNNRNRDGNRRTYKGKRFSRNKSPHKKELHICPLCEKPIKYMPTAIGVEGSKPAHFDCVIIQLHEKEEVRENDKICYLGNGEFGIIQYQGKQGSSNFIIRKRFQIEKKDAEYQWKKSICNPSLNNIENQKSE